MSKVIVSSDDSEDDVPLSSLKRKSSISKKLIDSDDDDLPLSALKKQHVPAPAPAKAKSVEKKKRVKTEKRVVLKEKEKTPGRKKHKQEKPKTKSPSSTAASASDGIFRQQECTEALYDSLKGRLVQELLCRWWYAIDWPADDPNNKDAEDQDDVDNASHFQELDGFTGAHIVVKGDDMGSILDKRQPSGKPTFLNFFAKPAEELKGLLVEAYTNQRKILIEHEGEDVPLVKELTNRCKSISLINTEKADSQAKKRLKVWKKYAEEISKLKMM